MRVTCAVRDYVKKMVLAKVADRLKAAEEAKEAAKAARADKFGEAAYLCERICAEAQEKFVKEAKRKLGLTFIPDTYNSCGKKAGGNHAVSACVCLDDFAETMLSCENPEAAKDYPCAERDEFDRIVGEPTRIRNAANAAADRLLFELELGKVAKNELDGLLKELEVEI